MGSARVQVVQGRAGFHCRAPEGGVTGEAGRCGATGARISDSALAHRLAAIGRLSVLPLRRQRRLQLLESSTAPKPMTRARGVSLATKQGAVQVRRECIPGLPGER